MKCYKMALLFIGVAVALPLQSFAVEEDSVLARDEATITPTQTASEPFAFADFTWMNGNSRQTEFPLNTKYFTGQFNLDLNYVHDFPTPTDHSLVGSTNTGRTSEFQIQQLGIGGDFHVDHVHARLMTQFGLNSTMTPRNDASVSRGQWDMANAYRYLSEAYAGYHWDALHGINLDAGIFMSYVGLCSYYDYENWIYQMSYVSANTPWLFNGIRLQIFPTDKLKIEPWLINGWQSYGMFNEMPGFGWQVQYRPTGNLAMVTNAYMGKDTLNNNGRWRLHSDSSVQYKYRDAPHSFLSKAAFSITADAGCENGGGVSCFSGTAAAPSQYFVGAMIYNRLWFHQDKFAMTVGGGAITNPGRYLVLLPAINGATSSTGTPYFTQNPGDKFKAWDASVGFDYMPVQFITLRAEYIHRWANMPYFAGQGGITPPGGNNGAPGTPIPGWAPDLSSAENRINIALMFRL